MRNLPWTLVLGILGALGGSAPTLAGTPTGAQPVPTQLAYEDSVVVTASTLSSDRDEIPAAVSVISAGEVADRQSPALSELLATLPGFAVATAGPPGQQTSVFVRGSESDQTLFLWNGVELNSPYFGGINWQFMGTQGVERIEAVHGPTSALYGGNAVGGVVQLLTKSDNGGSVALEAGEHGYYRVGLAGGRDFGLLRVELAGQSLAGDSEFENGFFDSDELAVKLGGAPTASTSLALVVRGNDAETGIPFSGGLPNRTAGIDWREGLVALPFSAELGRWSLASRLSVLTSTYEFGDPEDAFGFTFSDTDSTSERGRLHATYRSGESWGVSLGAELERLEVDDVTTFGVNLEGAKQRTEAAFVEANWRRERFSLDAGVRHDNNDVYGGATSLRTGLAFRATDNLRLVGSYGEAFRPPSLGELFFPFSGNRELEPEQAESTQLGVEWTRGPWRGGLTAFELKQRDLIDFDLASFRFANISRAKSQGFEGTVSYLGERWSLRANATRLEAENLDTGRALLRRPEESANLWLAFRPGKLTLSLSGRYVGERPDFNPATGGAVTNPSYVRLDLAGRFQLWRHLSPSLRVENLFDREYEEVAGYPAASRTVVGGITLSF